MDDDYARVMLKIVPRTITRDQWRAASTAMRLGCACGCANCAPFHGIPAMDDGTRDALRAASLLAEVNREGGTP